MSGPNRKKPATEGSPEFLSLESDQEEAVELLRAEACRLGDDASEMETHISRIFLFADRVWKQKRAIRLPYADFSTPERRLADCLKEVELNKRTAPNLYLGVRKVTKQPGGELQLDGAGDLVDAVVEMRRFDQESLFDAMAMDGRLPPALMEELAASIAGFHSSAPIVEGGGSDNIRGVLDINRRGFATSLVFAEAEIERLDSAFLAALDQLGERLDRRARSGKVRHCHGDLHLRNICMFEGRPTLFDCIEFNDTIATVDVLYDLAFLLMDLWHRDLHQYANLVLNRYLDQTDDEPDLVLVPFFMALRAAVRAHVTATQAVEGHGDTTALRDAARSYFDLAGRLLEPVPPKLVAIGGFSGSGKSTIVEAVAASIGAPPGARILESDRLRKQMFGVDPKARLDADAYRAEVGDRVYRMMAERARDIVRNGAPVAVDAVFDDPARRQLASGAAADLDVAFHGFWLDVPPEILRQRLDAREKGPSDADVQVLESQLKKPLGTMDWTKVAADQPPSVVVESLLKLMRQ